MTWKVAPAPALKNSFLIYQIGSNGCISESFKVNMSQMVKAKWVRQKAMDTGCSEWLQVEALKRLKQSRRRQLLRKHIQKVTVDCGQEGQEGPTGSREG